MNDLNQNKFEKYKIALNFQKNKEYEHAIRIYQNLIDTDPSFKEAYLNLGYIFNEVREYEKAIQLFQESIIQFKSFEFYYNLGISYYKIQNIDLAIETLETAVQINPKFIKSVLLLAYCYQKKNDFLKTEKYLIQAYKVDPLNKIVLAGLTFFYLDIKKYNESLKFLEEILKQNPSNQKMQAVKNELLTKLGDFHQLKKNLETENITKFHSNLTQEKKMNQKFFDTMGNVLTNKLNEYNAKIDLHNSNSEDFSPPTAQDSIDLSLMYLFNGNEAEALKYLIQAQKTVEEQDS